MRATAVAFALLCSAASIAAERPAGLATRAIETRSPAPAGSFAPALCRGLDGSVWLAWMEPAPKAGYEIRCSYLEADGSGWSRPLAIAPVSAMENGVAPVFAFSAAGRLRLAAAWIGERDGQSRVLWRTSDDGGTLWTRPEPLSEAGRIAREPALAILVDGRFLAAWLEAQAGSGLADAAGLHARILGPGAGEADPVVDRRTSAGSGPALVSFQDGGAGIAYRGLGDGGVRDILVSRLRRRNWTSGRFVNNDRWAPDSPPATGPALAADGGRLFVAWFTGADKDPRLLASSSPDAGERFLMPLTVGTGPIAGQPAAVLLHDGAGLVFWNSNSTNLGQAGLWMRRVTPEFTLDPASPVWPVPSGATPAAAIAQDYAGGDGTARVVVAFMSNLGKFSSVRTLELTIPEAALLAAADDTCHCAPTPEQLVGYPIRGTVLKVEPGAGLVTVDHDELPGILEPGSDRFRAAPELAESLKPGSRYLGRIERRGGEWQIFDVKLLLGSPQ